MTTKDRRGDSWAYSYVQTAVCVLVSKVMYCTVRRSVLEMENVVKKAE